jgi:hypothetical protein
VTLTQERKIPASALVLALIRRYGAPCPQSARQIHGLILDGIIPATREINGRYMVDSSDLDTIADIVGMTANRFAA